MSEDISSFLKLCSEVASASPFFGDGERRFQKISERGKIRDKYQYLPSFPREALLAAGSGDAKNTIKNIKEEQFYFPDKDFSPAFIRNSESDPFALAAQSLPYQLVILDSNQFCLNLPEPLSRFVILVKHSSPVIITLHTHSSASVLFLLTSGSSVKVLADFTDSWSASFVSLRALVHDNASFSLETAQAVSGDLTIDAMAYLTGAGASADIASVNATAQGNFSAFVKIFHLADNTSSNQRLYSVAGRDGHEHFRGEIYAAKGTAEVKAYQVHKSLLLDDSANSNANPFLEIYTDSVECSHGSSTGFSDDAALYYLRARGISAEDARSLLIGGFVADGFFVFKEPDYFTTSFLETAGTILGQKIIISEEP